MSSGRAWLGAVALTCSSCAGDGAFLAPEPVSPPGAVSFTELQDTLFTPRCAFAGCHAGPSAQQGLDLSPGTAYSLLVGVPSTELPAYARVEPGAPADSYLVMKLASDPRIGGERMPFGGPYLTEPEIERVRRWILDGALP